MDQLFQLFLIVHIQAGAVGLVFGTFNLLRKKGGTTHQWMGKLFLYSMLIVGVSAFVLSILHPNYFLFIVGVFTFYMAATGNRYLSLKDLDKGQKPKWIDWLLTLSMLLFGIAFVLFGGYHLAKSNTFGIVFIVFGFIGLRMVQRDLKNYRGKIAIANYWLIEHLVRMVGTYIAAITAFLVVNSQYFPLPSIVLWLLPTGILVPLIFIWTKKYTVWMETKE